jgi:hypothetical protein
MKGLSKFVGGKVRRGEKVFFLHIPLATKQWNIPLTTELGIYLHLPSPFPSKADLDHWGALFPRT